jgi:hypothetical protein
VTQRGDPTRGGATWGAPLSTQGGFHGVPPGATLRPCPSTSSGSSVAVESSAGGKAYDVSFRGRTISAPPTIRTPGGDASVNDLVARGRGTGKASRIVASGTFNERARDDRGKLSGLTGARMSRYGRGLSAPCAALANRR